MKDNMFCTLALAIAITGCEHKTAAPEVEPQSDTRTTVRIEDYQFSRHRYFFLSHEYCEPYRHFTSKWIHAYDPARGIVRLEVYKATLAAHPDAIPGIAYRILRKSVFQLYTIPVQFLLSMVRASSLLKPNIMRFDAF